MKVLPQVKLDVSSILHSCSLTSSFLSERLIYVNVTVVAKIQG